ncbi:MAG TPA: hypothetical protein VN365_07330 [Candidatus Thermoplasmatota archaeon]|nr:hypothetical protein [Candidatus Thermoplasmatota archaeon]
MIEAKEIPSEFVSIRQIWLKGIDDCRRAIGQRAIQESSGERVDLVVGDRTVCYMVGSLYHSLVDYGEALIRSDVDRYFHEQYEPVIREIWDTPMQRDDVRTTFSAADGDNQLSNNERWRLHCIEAINLYECIIQTLNKYGMLFEQQPLGYSNVEMKSVV